MNRFSMEFAHRHKEGNSSHVCSRHYTDYFLKLDGTVVSIFAFDLKNTSRAVYARNALKRFKTFRHPNILPCIITNENIF